MLPTLLVALVGVAEAAPLWESTPYVRPRLDLRAITVDGATTAQALAGVQGGVVARSAAKPHWMSHTRAAVTGVYSLTHTSLGAEVRAGSFFGPDGDLVRLQVGPDLWFDGYGSEDALDYHLPWSPGVDLHGSVTLKLLRGLALVGEATPGWALAPRRQTGGVGPFHELDLLGAVAIDTDVLTVTVGYQRSWNAVGVFDGIVLGGRL